MLAAGVALAPAAGWSQPTEPEEWTAPRTAWGDPDIGGVWNSSTVTPLERPEALGDQAFLTEEEAAAVEARVARANARANAPSEVRTEPLPVGGNVGAYNAFWIDRGTTVVPTRRTSLRGRPAQRTPARAHAGGGGIRQLAERQRLKAVREGAVPADSYAQVRLGRPVHLVPRRPVASTAYNNNYQVVQTADVIAIVQEHIHDVRFIHLDGARASTSASASSAATRWGAGRVRRSWSRRPARRPRLPVRVRPGPQGGTNWDLSPDLRVVERFTRVAPGTLDYAFTVHDPNVWTTPWTGSSPWARGDQPLYEYACHEGNYGMTNILAGSRAAEAAGQGR